MDATQPAEHFIMYCITESSARSYVIIRTRYSLLSEGVQIWSRKGCFCSRKAGLSGYQEKYHSPICIAVIQTCRFNPRGWQEHPHMARYCSAGLRNCKNKNSDIVSISESLGGGEGGIRTLAPVIPAYSLSRGAPSAILGYFSISMCSCWRRERDSNPRCLSTSPVFKTGALNLSAISPQKRQRRLFYQIHAHMSIALG